MMAGRPLRKAWVEHGASHTAPVRTSVLLTWQSASLSESALYLLFVSFVRFLCFCLLSSYVRLYISLFTAISPLCGSTFNPSPRFQLFYALGKMSIIKTWRRRGPIFYFIFSKQSESQLFKTKWPHQRVKWRLLVIVWMVGYPPVYVAAWPTSPAW